MLHQHKQVSYVYGSLALNWMKKSGVLITQIHAFNLSTIPTLMKQSTLFHCEFGAGSLKHDTNQWDMMATLQLNTDLF